MSTPGRGRPRYLLVAALFLLALATPTALAHTGASGASVQADVQWPAWVVWALGAAVVGLTFALVGAFLSRPQQVRTQPPTAVDPAGGSLGRPLQWAALVVLGLVAAHAITGQGLLPAAVLWLGLWVAVPLFSYLLAPIWPAISPFRALAALFPEGEDRGGQRWLERLGVLPAVAGVLVLTGLEVWGGPWVSARWLGWAGVAYGVWTVSGMAVVGPRRWLAHAELFERMMAWWATLAPLQREGRGWRWRWPGARLGGLVADRPGEVSLIVALLYGVNLDAFLATAPGRSLHAAAAELLGPALALAVLVGAGYLLFLGLFWACVAGVRAAAESLQPHRVLAGRFAVSLLPIAAAYHLAHAGPYLVEQAPTVGAALADPLGLGWQLLPWSDPAPLALSSDWAFWTLAVQAGLIVAGHVVAVVAAHHGALGAFTSRVQAVKSEAPLAAAMVAYTCIGLWIVSLGGGVP